VTVEGTAVPPSGVLITPALAFATLALYLLASLAIADVITRNAAVQWSLPQPPLAGPDVPSGQGLQPVRGSGPG
jgi:hypothetical protein